MIHVKKASDIKELMDLIEVGNYKEVIEYDFTGGTDTGASFFVSKKSGVGHQVSLV